MKLTNEQIQTAIAKLAPNIRQAIIQFDWATEIMQIGQDHHMQIDTIEKFRQETMAIILGYARASNYEQALLQIGIPAESAALVVADANDRIFQELQTRAFSDTHTEHKVIKKTPSADPYSIEPIQESDVHTALESEGVHLVDHSMEARQASEEMDYAIAEITKKLQQGISQQPTEEESSDDDIQPTETPTLVLTPTHKPSSDRFGQSLYHEPIDESDLAGIHRHRTNTKILKHQHSAEQVFADTKMTAKSTRDFGQKNIDQSLDKKIMSQTQLSKNDHIDLSPSDSEQSKQEGEFLQFLDNKK